MSDIETITTEYQTSLAALKGADGQPIYAPAEQERRQSELKAGLESKVGSIVEGAGAEIQTLQSQLRAAEQPVAPLDNLSAEELQSATARQSFVKEDIAGLGLEELGKRLQVLLEGKDRASLFLYVRYLPARLKALKPFEANRPEALALARLAREAEARLTTPADHAKVAKLKQKIEDLQRRQGAARKALQEATGPARRRIVL